MPADGVVLLPNGFLVGEASTLDKLLRTGG
jgi:hypothetical protein